MNRPGTFVSLRTFVAATVTSVLWITSFPTQGASIIPEETAAAMFRDETDSTSRFIISIWKTGEGLPVNEIQNLKDTADGYLWMGTQQGLVRFDGVRFQSFFTTPTGPRFGTRVGPLETDGKGRLWIAPDQNGLVVRDGSTFTETLTNQGAFHARATGLCSDGTNIFWVDANGGLGWFAAEHPNSTHEIKGGEASGSSRWARDFSGQLWLVNPRNLKLYQQGRWRELAPEGATLEATPRRDGGMWFARDAKLRHVNSDGEIQQVVSVPWRGTSRVTCLLEDRRKRLWVGTVSQGLYCYSEGVFTQVAPTATSITCLLEDAQDNVWAGTRGGGLIRIRERQFFVHASGLKNAFVRSLAEDKGGRVWMLTEQGGLGWWQNEAWHPLGKVMWPGYYGYCVLPTKDGSVWVSTFGQGLWRRTNGKFNKHELVSNVVRDPPTDLFEDHEGRLWMVTEKSGLYCLETNKVTHHTTKEGLPSDQIRRITEDESGALWAGDWEGGVARRRGEQWELVRKPSGHSDEVRTMVAGDGVLWIGTSAGGLLRLKDGVTARLSVESGLPEVCIQQLLLDGAGSLWGGTSHKLFRASVKQVNAVMDGREQRLEAITYGRSEGLPDTSFAAESDPRCWRAANGELWFATAMGAIHLQPASLPTIKAPEVLLEQTLLDGKPMSAEDLKRLRPGPGRLQFCFTAPCLTAPERVRFRYQLAGVDPDWIEAGSARVATYASVPAGNYDFTVMASSPDGVWAAANVATIGLAVHPFFWQTNWFFAIIAAGVAGGGVWIARRTTVSRLNARLERLRQEQALDRERTRIAQDIHDELGANLTSIGLLADMGTRHKSDPVAVSRELGQISQTARESVAAMDAIVWALNPQNDSLDHFANYVSQFTREFFRPTQLRTRLDLPTDLPTYSMATETRHQLFLIVKESFNNIVRHAAATEVNVELACENSYLRLMIADNGQGLNGHANGEGHDGLANLRQRIERLGGSLEIDSKKGQGARLVFLLPLAKLKPNQLN